MNLEFIKTNKCPICGCQTVINESVEPDNFAIEAKVREHCDGGKWEKRTFLCGYQVEYVPNFMKEEHRNNCRYDTQRIEAKKKAMQFYQEVIDFANSKDVNPTLKQTVTNFLERELAGIEYTI